MCDENQLLVEERDTSLARLQQMEREGRGREEARERDRERERERAAETDKLVVSAALQHTATHCNALQRTATHCNTLQHTDKLVVLAARKSTGFVAMADRGNGREKERDRETERESEGGGERERGSSFPSSTLSSPAMAHEHFPARFHHSGDSGGYSYAHHR